jgi:pimeloyl-ACP methyl ester carboxylesterase
MGWGALAAPLSRELSAMEIATPAGALYASTGGKPFDPAQPTVVFIHGAGMDHTVWALQTRWFAHHGRNVLAVDLPGHGRSAGPALRDIAAMADCVLAALDTVGAKRAALVGHSMGALVALAAAGRAPDRVAGLALLGVTPLMPVHPDLLAQAASGAHNAVDLIVTWAVGRQAQLGANEAPGLWLTGAALRLLERADPAVLAGDLAACDAYRGAAAAAASVTAPTLLLLGGDDRMAPPGKAVAFARTFRDGRSTVLRGVGHMMMLEDPAAVLAALKEVV